MVCYNFKIIENGKKIKSGICTHNFKDSYDKLYGMGVISDYRWIEFDEMKGDSQSD